MPEYFDAEGNQVDPFADDDNEGPKATLPRKVVRRLEKEAQEGRDAKAENAQLKRERAFVQAGIPLNDKRASYFIAGYQGEQTPEAIRQEWADSFGSVVAGQQSQVDLELQSLSGSQDLVNGIATPAPDILARRDAELASLSQTDPRFGEKFDAIMKKYGSKTGSLVG